MKWKRLYSESSETQTIPVVVSTKELKLVQNYLDKGKPLNDPSNKECLEVVIRILSDLVKNSDIQDLDTFVSNFMFENFGIAVDIDPYGENSAIELGENGLVPLSGCENRELSARGKYADLVQGGFWGSDGKLEEGFLSVDDINLVLQDMEVGNGISEIQLKREGAVAKVLLTFAK